MAICVWGEHKWEQIVFDPEDKHLTSSTYYKCLLCGAMSANHFNEADTPF